MTGSAKAIYSGTKEEEKCVDIFPLVLYDIERNLFHGSLICNRLAAACICIHSNVLWYFCRFSLETLQKNNREKAGGYCCRPPLQDGKRRENMGRENEQSKANYLMPWRLMEYDCREYGRQVRERQRKNREEEKGKQGVCAGEGKSKNKSTYQNAGEWLGEFKKSDRIAPVYTICLYHGTESWDGPRSLKDMMDFGETAIEEQKIWEKYFADYPMRLVCVNEPMDCSGMRTSLRELFCLLPYRKDKKMLDKLLRENPIYRHMDVETARTASILMGVEKFMEQEEKYKKGEEYDMCQALREMMEDSREEGIEKGESLAYALMNILIKQNRIDDLKRLSHDAAYREQLYQEFQL